MTAACDGVAAWWPPVGLVAGFGYAPREVVQGNVQRIMYLHLPSILVGYLSFIVAARRASYL